MKTLSKFYLLLSLFTVSTASANVSIVENGFVEHIAPVAAGGDSFYAMFKEGAQRCAGNTVIFRRSTFANDGDFNRLYSSLLTAMAASYKVTVQGVNNGAPCSNGIFLLMGKP